MNTIQHMSPERKTQREIALNNFFFEIITKQELYKDPQNADWKSELDDFNNKNGYEITFLELFQKATSEAEAWKGKNFPLYRTHLDIATELIYQFSKNKYRKFLRA